MKSPSPIIPFVINYEKINKRLLKTLFFFFFLSLPFFTNEKVIF